MTFYCARIYGKSVYKNKWKHKKIGHSLVLNQVPVNHYSSDLPIELYERQSLKESYVININYSTAHNPLY